MEFAKASSGAGDILAKIAAGPTNENIEALKKQADANKQDTTVLYNLALAYQNADNWYGAAHTWQKITDLLPTWEPSFYSKGYAYQKVGFNGLATVAFEKYIQLVEAKSAEEKAGLQEMLFGAYYSVALLTRTTDKAKATEFLNKALALNPTDKNALLLQKELSK